MFSALIQGGGLAPVCVNMQNPVPGTSYTQNGYLDRGFAKRSGSLVSEARRTSERALCLPSKFFQM